MWLKVYPLCFSNPRSPDFPKCMSKLNEKFKEMTERAFRVYRSLKCIQVAMRRGLDLSSLGPEKCVEILRYGKGAKEGRDAFADFLYAEENGKKGFDIHFANDRFDFVPLDVIESLRFILWIDSRTDRIHKFVYLSHESWFKIMAMVHRVGFRPIMIRIFYNPLLRAKEKLGIDTSDFESRNENFIDPDADYFEEFLKLNRRYAEDIEELRKRAYEEWNKWYGIEVPLAIKVTQIELARDMRKPMIEILTGFHFVGGRKRTINFSTENLRKTEVVIGGSLDEFDPWEETQVVKYYITVKKGLQLKAYPKAWRFTGESFDVLNRVEFTIGVRTDLDSFRLDYVLDSIEIKEIHRTLAIGSMNDRHIEMVKELISPLVRCRSRCEEHYAFLLDLILAGSIRGNSMYRKIAEVYKRYGIVKVKGRGRNSVYTFNESMLDLVKDLRKKLEVLIGEFKPLEIKR